MKKLFLHTGYNKTGSSYIQKCLTRNAAWLQQKGVFYPPDSARAYMQNSQHVPLAAALTGSDRF